MSKKSNLVLAIVIILAIIGVGYVVSKNAAQQANGPIKIGFATPLTGDAASWGLPVKRGAEIALDKINNEGGINGRKIELIFEDDKCDGKEGANIASKLINVDKVSAIIGTACSSVTLAMAPIVEQNKVLLLSAGASAPAIKDAGDYVFTIYPLDNYEAGTAVEFTYDQLGKKKAAVLYANNDFGKGANEVINQRFLEKGGQVVITEAYTLGSKDFRTQLAKVKNSDADVLFIWGQPNEMVPILIQAKELGLSQQIITTLVDIETEDLKKAGPEIAEGVIYTSFKTPTTANLDYLKGQYTEKYGKDLESLADLGYDVAILIADALKNGGADAAKMKDYLYSVKDFPGASGNMSFDQYGTVIKEFEFKTVKNGQFVPYQQ
ncbi:MAG: ABC transporter substrate-binding protein [Candidatus Pacebacteria bacterium]|nr:ABC transporter substrate-binding protein [Candidatus Paceibacterota bacterium]